MTQSLQDQFAPQSTCFGCGPANSQGLQLKSIVNGNQVTASWQPQIFHQAFPNVLNGGVIGTLLDCHCNWTAAWYLLQNSSSDKLPSTVTAEYTIKLLRPIPMDTPLQLTAELINIDGNRAWTKGKLTVNNKLCAKCEGLFVAVEEGHPAYNRW